MSTNPLDVNDWMRALGALVATGGMSLDDARERLIVMAPVLRAEFPSRAFCGESLAFVARRCKFFPTFHELCGSLSEWVKANRPVIPVLAIADDMTSMSAKDRQWLAYWHKRESENWAPLREPDGRLSRPDVYDWRAHTASLIRQVAKDAWVIIGDDA